MRAVTSRGRENRSNAGDPLEAAVALPTVTYGLLNKYVHVAARLRGEAVGTLAGILSAELLTQTLGETLAGTRGAGAYGAPAVPAVGGLSVIA